MRTASLIILFHAVLVICIGPVMAEAPSSDLISCYRASFRQSEVIADRRELIEQAQEHYAQAVGAMFPNLSGNSSVVGQDVGNGRTNTSSNSQSDIRISVSQPLFRGFADFAALRQTRGSLSAQVEARYQAMAQLYNDVAQNFYTVLAIEKDLADLNAEIDLYTKRVKELKKRQEIGQSPVNDVLSTESAVALLRVQVKQLLGQLDAAREAFTFLTGLDRETKLLDGATSLPIPSAIHLESVDQYLSGLEERPDIKIAEYQRSAAKEGISIARGAQWPSADVSANYYLSQSGGNQNGDWDVRLGLTVPVFTGGVLQSRVREAASKEREVGLAIARTKRQAETEIRTLYKAIESDREQLQALGDVRKISEQTYTVQKRDYQLGLVTNLDVLQALTNYQESIRALDRAFFAAKIDREKLETAAAKSPYRMD